MRGQALVALGVVVAPHGLRGELRVKLHNPASELLALRREVVLRGPAGERERRVSIKSTHLHRQGLLLVTLEGCADRDAAVALRGAELCVARSELPALAEGEHYLVDMIGLQARRTDGVIVGEVVDAIAYPASEVLRVRTEAGIWEIPMAPPYVVEIQLDQGHVIVDHLDDLEIEPVRKHPKG